MRGLGHTSCRTFTVILSEAKTTRIWLMYKYRDPALRSDDTDREFFHTF